MRAVVIEEFGGAEKLRMREMPMPTPEENEVLIEIAYTSVNPVDWMIREGRMEGRMPHKFPLIPGWDAAGIVRAKGRLVRDFIDGDKVYAYCRKSEVQQGTYAEYITLDQDAVALAPKSVGLKEAASIPLAGLTAWQALFDGLEVRKGETLLILGGAGGVGSFAVQFAKTAGLRVLATAMERHHTYLMDIGVDVPIDYTKGGVVKRALAEAPSGVDAVLDLIGGETQNNVFGAVRAGGRLVSTVNQPDPATAATNGVRALLMFVQPSGPDLRTIARLIDAGKVRIPRLEEYPLEEAAEAQRRSASHHVEGKIVLKVRE